MERTEIINRLPYGEPFTFGEGLDKVDADGAKGFYTFKPGSEVYRGHFKDRAVIPGVLLTECCAQIGLVCLGIFLSGESGERKIAFALSSSEMEFLLPVFPGERVRVKSEKEYFRFGKLKCKVRMWNEKDQLVCRGILAGMQVKNNNG